MQAFLRLWYDERPTVVLVTHDIHDALYLADQVIVLSQRPAHIEGKLAINVPHEARTFLSPTLIEYEKELYHLLGLTSPPSIMIGQRAEQIH